MKRKIILVLIAVLIIIQFFQPAKNNTVGPFANDISTKFPVPAEIKQILDKSCNDCHSNNTRYPWYSKIQPVGWWLANHVNEGKGELNFNEFASYPAKKQDHKLEELVETVNEGEMPLSSYTLIHTEAKLSPQEKQSLINWAKETRKQVKL